MKEETCDESERKLKEYLEEQPNYSNIGSHRVGNKYQTTVRFSVSVISRLEEISEATGLSMAEVVRRFVRYSMEEQFNG